VATEKRAPSEEIEAMPSGPDLEPDVDRPVDRPGRRRLLSVTGVAQWLLVSLVLWFVAAGYLAYDAQRHARDAEDSLRQVAEVADGDLREIDFAAVEADLVAGSAELSAARRSISSPVVRAMAPLPVLGRQLSSARAIISTSDDLADALLPLVGSARVAQSEPNAVDRVSFLRDTARQLVELQDVIEDVDLGPENNLVGVLADARVELAEQLAELAEDAADYEVITTGLASFFGEATYLVLGANNAEMQLGGGMHLSVGRVTVDDGDFDLPGLEPSSSFFPIERTPVVDPDVEAHWGSLKPSNDFRKLNFTVRFDDFGGPQALDMWEAQTGEQLDGVISIDPFVLDAILGVVGSVEVDGESYGEGDTLRYLLRGQYEVFDRGDEGAEVEARQDRLSLIAEAAVDRLTTSSWDPIVLLDALRPLARGRHILAFSDRPEEQAAWRALGIDGSVRSNSTGVALINDGGSKLDPFVTMSVDATVEDIEDGRRVSFAIDVQNTAPQEGLPSYAVGPWRILDIASPGTWYGRMAVSVPGWASQARFVERRPLGASGADGPLLLNVTQPLAIEPGESEQFNFSFVVPADAPVLRLIPSARFPQVAWTWSGREFTDSVYVDLD
jgi:hypothetical protein